MMRPISFLAAAIAGIGLTAGAPDRFSQVVAAVAAGTRAERAGAGADLQRAARTLAATGAKPIAGDEDLVERWAAGGGTSPPAAPYRNRALGPAYRKFVLAQGDTARFEQIFLAGQGARVAVVAAKGTAFQLSVSDDDGHAVCDAARTSGRCDWVPLFTMRFKFALYNPGPAAAPYYIVMQ